MPGSQAGSRRVCHAITRIFLGRSSGSDFNMKRASWDGRSVGRLSQRDEAPRRMARRASRPEVFAAVEITSVVRFIRLGLLVCCGAFGIANCPAGSIVGTVGATPPRNDAGPNAAGAAYESRRYKYVEKIDYDKLRDFVIYIDHPLSELGAGRAGKQTVK